MSLRGLIPKTKWATLWWNPPKVPDYPEVHHPGILFKKEGHLHHRLEEGARGPCVGPLLPQHTVEPRTLIPCPSHIFFHLRTVVVVTVRTLPRYLKDVTASNLRL